MIEREDLRITDQQVVELMLHIKRGEDILVIEQMLAKEKSNEILKVICSVGSKQGRMYNES